METGKGADAKVEDVTRLQRGQDSRSTLAGTRGASGSLGYSLSHLGFGYRIKTSGLFMRERLNSNRAAVQRMTGTCFVWALKHVKNNVVSEDGEWSENRENRETARRRHRLRRELINCVLEESRSDLS